MANFTIAEVEIDDDDDNDDDDSSNGGGSKVSSVTRVKETKTVKEVVEEINLQFKTMIGEEGVEVIGDFLEDVTSDQNLINILTNNKTKMLKESTKV